jgi:hypothetical protein
MAITKVTQYVEAAPEDTGDWAGHSDHITAYITQMMNQPILLTEWGTTDEPQIAQHVYLAHAGTLYQVDTADFDIATGDLSAAGNYWVKLTTSGDSLAVAWEDDISGFAWNHAYQGLYSGTSQVLPYMVYFDGVDEYTKYRYDLVQGVVVTNQGLRTIDSPSFEGLTLTESTYGSQLITDSGWVLPVGVYTFPSISGYINIQVYTGSAWEGGTEPISGTVISDGTNVRLTSSPEDRMCYYRKFS